MEECEHCGFKYDIPYRSFDPMAKTKVVRFYCPLCKEEVGWIGEEDW